MSRRARSAKIGAFVLGAIVLIVVVVAVFGSRQLFTKMQYYVIYFRGSAAGLDVGSPVRLRGVDIGEVKDVTAVFAEDWEFYVEVIIQVDQDAVVNLSGMEGSSPGEQVTALIARGLRAQMDTQSIVLGTKYIKLDLFPESELSYQFLNPRYPEIPSVPTIGEQVGQTFKRLVEEIEALPISDISDALLSAAHGVDSLVSSPGVRTAITEFELTLAESKALLEQINGEIEPLAQNVTEVSEAMVHAIAAADTLIVSLHQMTAESQVEMSTSIKELNETVRAMRNLLDYLQQHPDAVIWGKD